MSPAWVAAAVLAAGLVAVIVYTVLLRSRIGGSAGDLAALRLQVKQLQAEVGRLGGEVRRRDGRIAELEAEVKRLDAALAERAVEVAALEARLARLGDRLPPGAAGSVPLPRALPAGRDTSDDSTADGADLGPLVVRAAAVRGDMHREEGEYRRDCTLLRLVPEFSVPALLSVVAAGAPRGAWSGAAARRAAESLSAQVGRLASALGPNPFAAGSGQADGVLRTAAAGVANSVRLVAQAEAEGADAAADAAVALALTALITELGDRPNRRHLALLVGDGAILRLRAGAWERVFAADDEQDRAARLPARPEALRSGIIESRPGDVLAVCTRSTADLLVRAEASAWYARRWAAETPTLVDFLAQVDVPSRAHGADRALVCLWDQGYARQA
jgi:hypothetical protein